jgi:SAM-dependent methyltransferase
MKMIGCLDSPVPGAVFIPGEWIEISGWGLGDKVGAHWVEVRLDGRVIQRGPLTISRPDVLQVCPPARKSQNPVGYHFNQQLPQTLALGKHVLEIHLGDERGSWGVAQDVEFRVARRKDSIRRPAMPPEPAIQGLDPKESKIFLRTKSEKLERLGSLLRRNLRVRRTPRYFDCLTPAVKRKYRLEKADQESAHDYDAIALDLIKRHRHGLILDCGAGHRSRYFPQVVNLEIVPYPTTDVLGVNEEIPFKDNVFDAVFSLSVLEHVANPWLAAREIIRVLKPGGTLYCVAPFLQPLHTYPNHYFNMSASGLRQLFAGGLRVKKQDVLPSGLPIWALTWMIRSWAGGLPPQVREEFLELKLKELMGNPLDYLYAAFVTELSEEKNLELACATALVAAKPSARRRT